MDPEAENETLKQIESRGLEQSRSDRRVTWITIGCALLYGGLSRVVFAADALSKIFGGAATITFLFMVPFAMGALIAFLGMSLTQRRSIVYWGLSVPSISLLIGLVVAAITGYEAIFCIVIAAPILWVLTVVGALLCAWLVSRTGGGKSYVTTAVLLPYALAPVEQQVALPQRILKVENRILIRAPKETVWHEIVSVPPISRDELSWSWVHALGFPRPIAAVLESEGIGAVRIATFERDVSFFERVTAWQPPQTIAFSIEADPQFVPANAFDEHVIVGGRFYDVLDGCYRIEDFGDDEVILHLSSDHRLNTHLGRYASWWSERIMSEIQGNILEVIRNRAESINP